MSVLDRTLLALAICGMTVGSTLADWKEFRGPTGQGHSEAANLPTSWSEEQNILWKSELDGLAWSSPVILGDNVYLTSAVTDSADEEDGNVSSLNLVCVDLNSGNVNWQKRLIELEGKVKIHKKNSYASPTPIIHKNRIYSHFGPYGTICTSLDGEVIWKQKLVYKPVHGNGGSPALINDILVIACDGGDKQFVTGLSAKTGDIVWESKRDTEPKKGFSFATPLAINVAGQNQVVCPGSDAVFAYDPKDGTEIWRVDYPGGYSVTPRPVYAQGLVFVCSGFNKPILFAIDPTGSGNVTESQVKWQTDRAIPHTPSPLAVNENLYVVSDGGVATSFDAKTGDVHWQERLGGKYSASPLHASGNIYFQSEEGETIVVKASTEFEEIARSQIEPDQRTFASYAVEGNSLLLRSESHLYRIAQSK